MITMDAGLSEQTVASDNDVDTGGNEFVGVSETSIDRDPASESADHTSDRADLVILARSISAARRKLTDHLDASLFANPGLDIMLFLFAEGTDGATVTTNACCAAAGVPRTTALRWIKLLQDRGLVLGSDDISDRRVTMLALTTVGRDTIRTWLGEIVAIPLEHPATPDH